MSQVRQRQEERGIPDGLLVGVLALLLGLTLLAWTSTGLGGLLAHGAWPDGVRFTRAPQAVRRLLSAPDDLAAAWPATPAEQLSGWGLFWGLLIGQLMVLGVLAVAGLRGQARRGVRRPAGTPSGGAAASPVAGRPPGGEHWGPGNTGGDIGHRDRRPPDHAFAEAQPATASPRGGEPVGGSGWEAAARGLAEHGTDGSRRGEPARTDTEPPREAHAAEDSGEAASPRGGVLYGGPETRRPTALRAVRDAEGPALVVTSDPSLWAETKDARAKLGPVLVYDPGHLCDTPARLHWSPSHGCESADIAAARAVALLAPVRPQARMDTAMADTAETLLRCWLHAAAVDGRPFKQVHRWAQGGTAHEAVRVLRTHPKAASGAAGLLESALTAHAERRDIAQELVTRALTSLSSIHIREACTPNRADSLTLESFVDEGGTLYVVGEAIEDPRSHPGAMPLLTALASSVVEHGRRMAARSSDGRLDPPLTLVLDDIAAVAPLPLLPGLLTTGQEQGLPTLALLRSREQGRARWTRPLVL
ncbi:type IV secretory system conjugative DNA transfer family protein [Streptomyces sannanensis]|uniref:Type IV secretory system conjugative DNA transfer family protein n=1 Tax=Streptomyces sannanensis TaxID=285536 RepID=A0ABP6SBP3_9ACTN